MLAIVIPYYKIFIFEKTLASLSAQTSKDFKVYIGNDASPEDPIDLINSYSNKLNITYQRFEKNLGGTSLTGQWSRCIEMVQKEEWIMILGDDDLLDKSVVENFYLNFNAFNGKASVIRFASIVVDPEGIPKSPVFKHPEWEEASDSFFRWFNGEARSSLSEHLFTKKTYLKYKFKDYPLGWHSDDIAWLDFPDGKKIFSINNCIVMVTHSEHNITTATNNLNLKNEAANRFQYDLIFEKLKMFQKPQKKRLLLNFETFKKDKKDMLLKDWNSLLIIYFQHCNFYDIMKLWRRFFIYQLKKIK